MARVAVDTNVLISAMGWKGNERELILSAMDGSTELILGVEVIKEFEDVISREKFSFLNQDDVGAFFKFIVAISEVVHPKEVEDVIIEDPDDDMVLASAVEGRAEVIISGDRHLLGLRNYRGIPIMTASSYLRVVDPNQGERSIRNVDD